MPPTLLGRHGAIAPPPPPNNDTPLINPGYGYRVYDLVRSMSVKIEHYDSWLTLAIPVRASDVNALHHIVSNCQVNVDLISE